MKQKNIYSAVVNFGGHRWSVNYAFDDFRHLHAKLKKLFPEISLKFPAKRFLFTNKDPEFLKLRQNGLQEFVNGILTNSILVKCPDVRDFLKFSDFGASNSLSNLTESSDESETSNNSRNDCDSSISPTSPSDFEFLKVIGNGSFGKVFLARHKSEDNLYAVKVLRKLQVVRKNETKHIMSERCVLEKTMQHPFLVGLHYSFQTADKLYLVLDYVNGGELFRHLQSDRVFPEERAKFYAAEIASALGYLHSYNIIFRDLKPENILLDSEGHVVLTDFGLCKQLKEYRSTTSTFCGTPEYLAPEILAKEPHDRMVDWWCLGVVLYEMLYGLPPFYAREVSQMYENILDQNLRFKSSAGSEDARSLLEGLLRKDKHVRLGIKNDLEDVRKHSFFSSLDWELLEERKLTPPYNPSLKDKFDLQHFDTQFVSELVPESVTKPGGKLVFGASLPGVQAAFTGFSYAPQPTLEDKL